MPPQDRPAQHLRLLWIGLLIVVCGTLLANRTRLQCPAHVRQCLRRDRRPGVSAQYDEFPGIMWQVSSAAAVASSKKLQAVFGTDAPIEPGRVYGSLANGSARVLYTPAITHPMDHISPTAIGHSIDAGGLIAVRRERAASGFDKAESSATRRSPSASLDCPEPALPHAAWQPDRATTHWRQTWTCARASRSSW